MMIDDDDAKSRARGKKVRETRPGRAISYIHTPCFIVLSLPSLPRPILATNQSSLDLIFNFKKLGSGVLSYFHRAVSRKVNIHYYS